MPRTTGVQRLHILALLLAVASCDPMCASADDGDVVERFKVEKDGDALLVPVKVAGKEYLFLVDTGSTMTVFDRTLLAGKPKGDINVHTSASRCPFALYEVPKASLGLLDFRACLAREPSLWIDPRDDSCVAGLDFTRFREVLGRDIYGIIGMDFLHHYVLQIDFDEGELQLLRRVNLSDRSDSIELHYNSEGVPLVRCRAGHGGRLISYWTLDSTAVVVLTVSWLTISSRVVAFVRPLRLDI